MNADGFVPDATSRDPFRPADAAAPAVARTWRRDVVDGVTRRFAIAIVPALMVALIVRLLMSDWALVAVCGGAIAAAAVSLSRTLSPGARVALIVGVFVSTQRGPDALRARDPFSRRADADGRRLRDADGRTALGLVDDGRDQRDVAAAVGPDADGRPAVRRHRRGRASTSGSGSCMRP